MTQAAGPDQWLRPTQRGAGHAGEQVVLDLIVQTAHGQLDPSSAADVARGEHLAAQKVQPVTGTQQGHSLVGGREATAQVDPEQALLNRDERHRLHRRQDKEHRGQVTPDLGAQQHRLDTPGAVSRACAQRPDAGDVQGEALEEQQRKEQGRLVAKASSTCMPVPEGQGRE